MIEILSALAGGASVPDVAERGAPPASAAQAPAQAASKPLVRLTVHDGGAGGYVYHLVDVSTGQVLAEIPRERVRDLKDIEGYAAGALVSTHA